ncbi:class A beta-lactamase-related serine hydrolase [Microbacterium bovistercoris]|uniref:Class A beta-lactamase-related serine hydrolase n=1 Tax=Microbacterium bovistercoris TaxID=2293570 RepID=A0A371NVP5_9MICO|nr:serine hydrolase domain-containing protein [Microbacterium bovistercoris]REJ06750.1 class A beta-lactamase-related serine hydrolase [Microbacterium bovistercoris]
MLTTDQLPSCAPERQGLSSAALIRLLDELERGGLDPHALIVARRGHVLFRTSWAPWSAEQPALVYSVSKTFTAFAIGLLEADGAIDLDAPVERYLGGENPNGITVRHLLTMNTGHSREQTLSLPFSVPTLLTTPPAAAPGSSFAYNSPASYALSAVVEAVSGLSLTGLLRGRVFDPLGIGQRWWIPLDGIDQGFSGLHLEIDDLARTGIMLADGGRFRGRQVIPATYVEAMARPWSDNRDEDGDPDGDPDGDWSLGYGFQVWRSRHGFRLDGAYGQFVLVMPETGVVVAYQGATTRTHETLNALWRLVESFHDDEVAPSADDSARLAERAATRDSWISRHALAASDPMPDPEAWMLADAADGGWLLTTPLGEVAVPQDRWSHAVLGTREQSLAVAARGERAGDDVLVHLVVPTSPHRAIISRGAGGLSVAWHTTPLWHPSLGTLTVPEGT